MEKEIPNVHAGLEHEHKDIIVDACWIIKETEEYKKEVTMCFIDYRKALDYVDHVKLWREVRKSESQNI